MTHLENGKIEKYKSLKLEERGYEFIVCAMETLGGMNKETLKVIDRLSEQKAKMCLTPKSEIKRNIIQTITTKVLKNVAAQITHNFVQLECTKV